MTILKEFFDTLALDLSDPDFVVSDNGQVSYYKDNQLLAIKDTDLVFTEAGKNVLFEILINRLMANNSESAKSLKTKLEADARNSARYVWLRQQVSQEPSESYYQFPPIDTWCYVPFPMENYEFASLDDAIDWHSKASNIA